MKPSATSTAGRALPTAPSTWAPTRPISSPRQRWRWNARRLELENFGGSTNAVPDADADADAFDNRSEYIAGTSPHDDTSYLRITQSEIEDREGNTQITLHWTPSVAGRIYGVSWSTNLVDGFQDRILRRPYPDDQITFENDLPVRSTK